jgi:hypothetical protein
MSGEGFKMPNLNPMGFWGRCESNPDVCGAGVIVGLITAALIVIILWFFMRKSERFTNPNDLPPEAAALLAAARAADPLVSKTERMRNREHASNKEDSRLVDALYR